MAGGRALCNTDEVVMLMEMNTSEVPTCRELGSGYSGRERTGRAVPRGERREATVHCAELRGGAASARENSYRVNVACSEWAPSGDLRLQTAGIHEERIER